MDILFSLVVTGVVIALSCLLRVLYMTHLTLKESLECDEYPSEHEVED